MSGTHRQASNGFGKKTFVLVVIALVIGIATTALFSWSASGSSKSVHINKSIIQGAIHAASPAVSKSIVQGAVSAVPVPIQTSPKQRAAEKAAQAKPTLVYVVRSGDYLNKIARWFHSHGYMPLYVWNKSVVGNNPNMIYPGQKLIVSPGSNVQKVVNH